MSPANSRADHWPLGAAIDFVFARVHQMERPVFPAVVWQMWCGLLHTFRSTLGDVEESRARHEDALNDFRRAEAWARLELAAVHYNATVGLMRRVAEVVARHTQTGFAYGHTWRNVALGLRDYAPRIDSSSGGIAVDRTPDTNTELVNAARR